MIYIPIETTEVGPIVEYLKVIAEQLSEPDLLGIINILLVPISIWVTARITSKQARILLEDQSQHDFEKRTYESTHKSLIESRDSYLSNLSEKTRSIYALKNFITGYYIKDTENPDGGSILDYPLDEFKELSAKLAETIVSNRTNLIEFRKDLIDSQSLFEENHKVNISFQSLIDFIEIKGKKTDSLVFRVITIHRDGKTSHESLDQIFKEIVETFYPFDSEQFSSDWKYLISLLNYRKVRNPV